MGCASRMRNAGGSHLAILDALALPETFMRMVELLEDVLRDCFKYGLLLN